MWSLHFVLFCLSPCVNSRENRIIGRFFEINGVSEQKKKNHMPRKAVAYGCMLPSRNKMAFRICRLVLNFRMFPRHWNSFWHKNQYHVPCYLGPIFAHHQGKRQWEKPGLALYVPVWSVVTICVATFMIRTPHLRTAKRRCVLMLRCAIYELYIYIFIFTHISRTHTHIHIYVYIYIYHIHM